MNMDNMPMARKVSIVVLSLLPLIASIAFMVYLKMSWQVEISPGEMLSPIENKPLFVGLLIFISGYLFFLGMLFSENILELFNKRISLLRR